MSSEYFAKLADDALRGVSEATETGDLQDNAAHALTYALLAVYRELKRGNDLLDRVGEQVVDALRDARRGR